MGYYTETRNQALSKFIASSDKLARPHKISSLFHAAGAGEKVQWLREHSAGAEDLNSVPSAVPSELKLSIIPVPGDTTPSSVLLEHCTRVHTYTDIHKLIIKKNEYHLPPKISPCELC